MAQARAGDHPDDLPEEFQAARLSIGQWLRLLLTPKALLVVLAAAGVWVVAGLALYSLLPDGWEETPVGVVVGMAVISAAAEILRSDVRRRATRQAMRARPSVLHGPPAIAVLHPSGLREALVGRARRTLVAAALGGTLVAAGLFVIAGLLTWQVARAVGIADGGRRTTGTVVGVDDSGLDPRYRVAFMVDGRRVEAVVQTLAGADLAREQQVPVVYDPAEPARAAFPDEARWSVDVGPWLFGAAGIVLGAGAIRRVRRQRSELRAATESDLDTTTVATVLGVGSGFVGDEYDGDVLLQVPSASPQLPDRRLAFSPRWRPRACRLVRGDQVVVYGTPLAGEHVVLQTADGRILLPRGPLRRPPA